MNDIEVIAEDKNDLLMVKVIESGNIDALERFIALREREESRHANLAFDKHFSAMQSEFGTVERTKKAYGYKYAPLEDLQREYSQVISKHGFSYTWNEEAIEGGKRCTMTISGYGASRSNSFDIPQLTPVVSREGKVKQNAVQVAGAMSTYGRRYSFIAGFGVIIADEDTDAVPEKPIDVAMEVQALKACKDLNELMTAWKGIYAQHKNDNRAIGILSAVKDDMKAELV